MPTESATQATPSKRKLGRVFFAMAKVSLLAYYENLVSLFMTLGVPLLFMAIYGFAFSANNGTPRLTVAFSPQISQAFQMRVTELALDGLIIVPAEGTPQEILATNQARMYFDFDKQSSTIVLHAGQLDRLTAEMLVRSIDAGAVHAKGEDIRIESPKANNSDFAFFPGILIMSLLNLGLFTAGAKMLQDRASGALRLYQHFPMPLSIFIGAEFFAKFLLAIAQTLFFLALGNVVFALGMTFGQMLWACFVAIASSISLFALGYAMGSVLKSYSKGVHAFTAVNLFMIFLGDIAFPASSFEPTRAIALSLPTTHCVSLLRIAMSDAAPTVPTAWSVAYLVLFSVIAAYFSMRWFKFSAAQ